MRALHNVVCNRRRWRDLVTRSDPPLDQSPRRYGSSQTQSARRQPAAIPLQGRQTGARREGTAARLRTPLTSPCELLPAHRRRHSVRPSRSGRPCCRIGSRDGSSQIQGRTAGWNSPTSIAHAGNWRLQDHHVDAAHGGRKSIPSERQHRVVRARRERKRHHSALETRGLRLAVDCRRLRRCRHPNAPISTSRAAESPSYAGYRN